MGCNQSQPTTVANMPSYPNKWATSNGVRNGTGNGIVKHGEIDQPPPEFRESLSKSYQEVMAGRLSSMTKSKAVGSVDLEALGDDETRNNLLVEYQECEKKIRLFEREDPLILYYVKQSRLKDINETIKRHEEMTESLKKRLEEDIAPEGRNGTKIIRSLRSALIQAGDTAKLSKEEQDVIARKNQLEIATTEMEMLLQEKALLESDIMELKLICANLTQNYKRQEDIAGQLSISQPGRSEQALLDELTKVETRRIKISEVLERWKEGRIQISDSCRAFSSSLKKWREIKDDSVENQFDMAEEARDELITALQFLSNGRFYVQHDFPYCTKQEIAILNKALTYIFVDMRTEERRKHADNCYAAFHNRAVALYAWIDTALKAIIQPVVLQTAEDLRSIMGELQEVRFQSIKSQFPDVKWQNTRSGRTSPLPNSSSEDTSELLSDKMSISLLEQLDLSQLAPLPRTVEIFGRPTDDLVESYRTTLRDSLDKEVLLEKQVIAGQERKESMKDKKIENGTVGLV